MSVNQRDPVESCRCCGGVKSRFDGRWLCELCDSAAIVNYNTVRPTGNWCHVAVGESRRRHTSQPRVRRVASEKTNSQRPSGSRHRRIDLAEIGREVRESMGMPEDADLKRWQQAGKMIDMRNRETE